MDNLFVFILVFKYFKTPLQYQPKVERGVTNHDFCLMVILVFKYS